MAEQHDWKWESGRSRTCSRCLTVRFSYDGRGRSVANVYAASYRYQRGGRGKEIRDEPPCEVRHA